MGKASLSFGHGCAISRDIAYMPGFLDALDDEVRFTRLAVLAPDTEEKWFHHDLDGHRIVSVCLRKATASQERAACALSDEGVVEFASRSGNRFEQIPGAGLGPGSRGLGTLSRIREVGNTLFACGAGNQLYERQDGTWRAIDQQITAAPQAALADIVNRVQSAKGGMSDDDLLALTARTADLGGLDDIAGHEESDLYTCGLAGQLWHWNGQQFQKIEIPTSEHLHAIHVVSPETVYVCGHNGTLLKGNKNDGFRSLIGPEVTMTFWGVREFDGKVYLSTTEGLFVHSHLGFYEVPLPKTLGPTVINALDSSESVLWAFAQRFAARLIDDRWERFDHPDNRT